MEFKKMELTSGYHQHKYTVNLHLIATGNSNWDYYVSDEGIIFSVAKYEDCLSSYYCPEKLLYSHFLDLQRIAQQIDKNAGIIPRDWNIVDEEYFKSLNII